MACPPSNVAAAPLVAADNIVVPRFRKRGSRKKASSIPHVPEAVQEPTAGPKAVPEPPTFLVLPAPPKLLALPAPPKLLALPAQSKFLALPESLKLLALPASSLMQATPLLPVLSDPLWSSDRTPELLKPRWSILPVPPWLSVLFGWSLAGSSLRLCPGPLPGLLDCLSLPGSTLSSLPGPSNDFLGLPAGTGLAPLLSSPLCLCVLIFLSTADLCVGLVLSCHAPVLFLVFLVRDTRWLIII